MERLGHLMNELSRFYCHREEGRGLEKCQTKNLKKIKPGNDQIKNINVQTERTL